MGSKGTTRDKNVRGNMVGIFYSRCACLFGSFDFVVSLGIRVNISDKDMEITSFA